MPPRSSSPASDEEVRVANRIMDMVDNGKASTLSLDSAIAILTQRGLSLSQLHNIWPLADRGSKGHLTNGELIVAIRLIGWVQAGHEVSQELMDRPGPLPMLRGITDLLSRKLPVPAISPLMRRVSMITPKQQTVEKVFEFNHNETFRNVFLQDAPIDGLLGREQILEIFISRFSISFRYLAQIFELIDFSKRDALDIEEFCLGMHILEAFDSSSRLVLPPTIPPDICDQLIRLQSLISKATSPLNMTTGRSAPVDRQRIPDQTISSQSGTHRDASNWTTTLSTERQVLLSAEIEEDMILVRDDLAQMGLISGELMTKFRLRYRIYPIELARIWNSIPGYDAVPVSPETIETAIKCIRTKLTESLTASVHSPVPSTSVAHFSFESDTKHVPDFASLPHRVMSPASSEYSSTDTVSSVPEVKPFLVLPIDEEEEWPHTDSSTASSSKWSRRPPASYSGSYSSSAAAKSRKAKPNPPPICLRRSSDVPAGNQYFSEEIKSLRVQLQEVQHRLSGTMSSDKQSRLQRHYTDEIDRLTSALAQKNVQYEASHSLLGELQESANKLSEEKDDLRKVVEAQTEEISELMIKLEQAKHDIKELASTSTSPNMLIFFLRASLREARAEVERVKEDAEKLQELVAAQKTEISQLNVTISQQASVVETVQEGCQTRTDDALGSLGFQTINQRWLPWQNPARSDTVSDYALRPKKIMPLTTTKHFPHQRLKMNWNPSS
ncbi:hypothetical protein HYPSUDRAFT_649710 [Hypholoma sublateritium FD-334 SS-4]|uniref:EH domain-containing protein n=1 Tax=Hypholoma sublateritium (strain FD-334 SS-4) TaxID=945553 RepID=A0A0D2L6C5_HYPSF|nr:hypothetical protein HYPSUDRAFT_649710 [Hypholoma sublateritium FD-334 SS-4]